jgi:hypothetical protein
VAVDVICVVLFAIIGRSSHAEANDLAGVLHTAWPFLTGCAVGWLLARVWRHPAALGTGTVVWLCTVAGGIALRLLSGSTAQPAFVVVATITLGLLLLGWRGLYRLVQRARRPPVDQPVG